MNKFSGIAKGGWRPGSNTPSYQKDHRDPKTRLKGAIGRGNQHSELDTAMAHQSAPLSSLRDPSGFEPPPKHREYHHNAPTTRAAPSPPSSASAPAPVPPPPRDNSGMGGAIPASVLQRQDEHRREVEEEETKPKAPQVPYRANTTGFDASNMPLPPRHQDVGERRAPPPPAARATPPIPGQRPTPPVPARGGSETSGGGAPKLPPRLPPRQNSHPDMYTPDPPPSYGEAVTESQHPTQSPSSQQGYLNQGALNRLGNAGVQVPGLNIGQNSNPSPPVPSRTGTTSPAAAGGSNPQVGELQARFARMNTGSSSGSTAPSVAGAVGGLGKKKPPPPPAKKPSGLGSPHAGSPANPASPSDQSGVGTAPPPIPLASKPRPG